MMNVIVAFLKRNLPVFILGAVIAIFFAFLIIVSQNKKTDFSPASFKRVEEDVFNEREATNPVEPEEEISNNANTSNDAKPLFLGEYNPSLRDEEGFPTPPKPESIKYPKSIVGNEEDRLAVLSAEQEEYARRTKTIYIDYTEAAGFTPNSTSATTGQKIVWTNKSATTIKLEQTLPKFDEFKNGVEIEPNKTFEFRPTKDKLFTYIEATSRKFGAVTIGDATAPLINFGY